jgi:mannose-P-dolichol utilization defect protein 1
VFLQFGGSLSRIFISIQDTGDQLIIFSVVIAAILNAIIFAQMLIYWNPKGKKIIKTNKRV